MIPDLDSYRAAKLLIHQHGEDAPIGAAERANLLFARGDIAGFQAALTATIRGQRHKWSRIHDSLGGARYSPPLLVNVYPD
jgi:hypothetical protein